MIKTITSMVNRVVHSPVVQRRVKHSVRRVAQHMTRDHKGRLVQTVTHDISPRGRQSDKTFLRSLGVELDVLA